MTDLQPLDPYSEVVDTNRRWTPDWYGWITQLAKPQPAPPAPSTAIWINVKTDFGAAGDGFTDDTAAINAAFASIAEQTATVYFPPGSYKITDTIVVGKNGSGGGQSHINIFGQSAPTTILQYAGATNKTILLVCKNTNFWFRDFWVNNNTGTRGTTVGIRFGSNGFDSGNQTSNAVITGVIVQNCNVGITDGNGGAFSEFSFINCSLANCDTGFIPNDFNTLDMNFLMLSMGGNGVGVDSGVGGGFHVFGGSSSFNNITFQIRSNANCLIQSWRSEVDTTCFNGINGRQASLINCGAVSPPSPFVTVGGSYVHLRVQDCVFEGLISPSNFPTSMFIHHNRLQRWDMTRKMPIIAPSSPNQQNTIWASFKFNFDISTFPPIQMPDYEGYVGTRYDGAVTVLPFYDPGMVLIENDLSGAAGALGANYLALNHVRHLGEGPIPGATAAIAPTPGQNLRVQGTFATSNSLSFTFTRSLTTNTNSTPTVTATAGIFLPTDVGKPMKITGGADTGADWYGYVTEYIDSTHVKVYPSFSSPGNRYPGQLAKATTVGADEPDANYFIAGLSGNANETFWVTGIGTTGFTLHSSIATSTATVICLIVR